MTPGAAQGRLIMEILIESQDAAGISRACRKGVHMDSLKYHEVAVGARIYSLRMAKGMTQEQLAEVLSVTPAAVSKWERDLAVPSIELLWALADFFDCDIDDLVGRKDARIEAVGAYDAEKLRLSVTGEDLLKCGEISRQKGFPAMQAAIPGLKSESAFLAFSIPYMMYLTMRQTEPEQAFGFLENYAEALPEAERREGHMIAAALKMIFAGGKQEELSELIASYIGMEYRQKGGHMGEILNRTRQEIIDTYKDKEMYSGATDLLEEAADLGDFEIQTMLRNMDEATLTAALAGASGRVAVRFLSNLADRVLYFIHEDVERWSGTEEEVLAAQRKVLEIGSFCMKHSQS